MVVQRRQRHSHAGRFMTFGALASSCFVVALAFAPIYWIAFVLIMCAGVMHSIFLVISMTTLQLRVPPELRGRVMGIYTLTFSFIPLGGLLGGSIAELLDERWALSISATVFAVITVLVFLTQREVGGLRSVSP